MIHFVFCGIKEACSKFRVFSKMIKLSAYLPCRKEVKQSLDLQLKGSWRENTETNIYVKSHKKILPYIYVQELPSPVQQ